jgi:predicted nucleic acid-binding protein
MIISYHLANHARYSPYAQAILEAVESGQPEGLITTVTLAEVLTRPAQANDRRAMQDYELYLTHFPHLRIVPLDADLARETARTRAETGLRTPDAVHIAAARLYGADAVVTNDHLWQSRVNTPTVILLDEYV